MTMMTLVVFYAYVLLSRRLAFFWRFLKNLNFCACDGLGFTFETLNNSQTMHKKKKKKDKTNTIHL